MRYIGICDKDNIVADVAEFLYTFDHVQAELLIDPAPWLWCWPVSWLRDVITEFIFFQRQGLFFKRQAYERADEFGFSASTGIVKVFIYL